MPSVSTRLGDVVYQTQGEGVPVILLHANLHDHHDFDTIATRLAENYRTIAVDWPWHGESKGLPTTEKLSAPALADVLEEIVAALKLPPAFFIGNSVGGFAAARLAITHPEYVRGLVLVNNGGFASIPWYVRVFCRVLGTPFFTRLLLPYLVPRYMVPQTPLDEVISHLAQERARTQSGAAVAAAIWRSFTDPGHDLRSRGSQIKAPTLIVWGSRDITFPPDVKHTVQECIPGSQLKVFETGHVVFSSKPDEFLSVVEPFFLSVLESLEARASAP
jgi:pimeloyl-ACP methyl ester carboxylesterase